MADRGPSLAAPLSTRSLPFSPTHSPGPAAEPSTSSRRPEHHVGQEPRPVRSRFSRRRARIPGLQPLPQAQAPVLTRAACMPTLPKGSNSVRV